RPDARPTTGRRTGLSVPRSRGKPDPLEIPLPLLADRDGRAIQLEHALLAAGLRADRRLGRLLGHDRPRRAQDVHADERRRAVAESAAVQRSETPGETRPSRVSGRTPNG